MSLGEALIQGWEWLTNPQNWMAVEFRHPERISLLLPLIVVVGVSVLAVRLLGFRQEPALLVPRLQVWKHWNGRFPGRILRTLWISFWSGLGAVLLVLVSAEPVFRHTAVLREVLGVDIMLVMDVSTSMLAEDLRPNRLEAARQEALRFAEERRQDRIGLVAFAGEAVMLVPPTVDREFLQYWIHQLDPEMFPDGTAIGLGLALAIARLEKSDARSRVIILLTDGENNTGFVAPEDAAQLARQLGIRIYTIGVGTHGKASVPVQTPLGTVYRTVDVRINEQLLREVAHVTGGKYFRATSRGYLREIFGEIDRMEKSRLEVEYFRMEEDIPEPFLVLAFFCFLLAFVGGRLGVPYP